MVSYKNKRRYVPEEVAEVKESQNQERSNRLRRMSHRRKAEYEKKEE
jgi:hypothetical protein